MKLLIIEDDRRVAGLLGRVLRENGYNVELAFDGLSGKKLAMQNDYDLIITDIILPHKDGIQLCKEIRSIKPEIPVLMLTALGTTDDKVEGFDAGADDYMVKPFEIRELLARVRALLKRRQKNLIRETTTLTYADLEMNLLTKEVRRSSHLIHLTPKEFNLLKYFMENPERVLSRQEIAEKVWDTHFDTGTNFIDVYINYLRKKIDKEFSVRLLHTRPGMGFILKSE